MTPPGPSVLDHIAGLVDDVLPRTESTTEGSSQ